MFDQDPIAAGVTVTADILRQICPHTNYALLQSYVPFIQKSLGWADATTPLRASHFTSQIGYETAWFAQMVEAVDPANTINTPFDKYEVGTHIAKLLGNTSPCDGDRFKGRGWPMITGRDNYTRCGKALGLDLVNHPELAALPENAARIAAWYWSVEHNINPLADADDCVGVTKVINGGTNGLQWRQTALLHAKIAFGITA